MFVEVRDAPDQCLTYADG